MNSNQIIILYSPKETDEVEIKIGNALTESGIS